MAIKLIVEPRKTYNSWREFRSAVSPYSIALDGIVNDSTRRDTEGPYANFDHHTKVDRASTRATCAQVLMEINLGLFSTFQKDGIPTANIYVNDCDEDVCLSVWLLRNHEKANEGVVRELVYLEDKLDATAGAYPFGEGSISRKMEWIFEPYRIARFNKQLDSMDEVEMKSLIDNVCSRISQYVNLESEEKGMVGQYEIIGGKPGNDGWCLVEETGSSARLALFNNGISAFVSVLGQREDGNYNYVIGKKSVWIPFPVEELYKKLNEAEGKSIKNGNRWGGSNTIGGSPRETGSKLQPKQLEKIINDFIN